MFHSTEHDINYNPTKSEHPTNFLHSFHVKMFHTINVLIILCKFIYVTESDNGTGKGDV